MYKLKIKSLGCKTSTTRYFNTLQEVADNIRAMLNAETLAEVLAKQKEYNLRFYVSETKSK